MKKLLVVSALFGVPFLSMGCDQKIDKAKLESTINEGTKAKGLTFSKIDCPADQLMKKGNDFDCEATAGDGDKVKIHVSQGSDTGDVNWALTGTILDTSKLGDSIESKVGAGADVKCPAATIVLTKGKVIKCTATIEGAEKKVEITASDDSGNVSWKIAP